MSRVRENLRRSKLEIQQSKMRTPGAGSEEEEANRLENERRLREGNVHSADYNRREIRHTSENHTRQQEDQNVRLQIIEALRDATAAARGGTNRQNKLIEEYPCGMTMTEYYDSLPEPWDVEILEDGPVKELHKVKITDKFAGDRMGYTIWRRRFFAMVHTQRMLVSDKAVALSAALDTKQEILSQVVRGLNYDARTYAAVIRELERLFGGAEAEVMLASTKSCAQFTGLGQNVQS